MKAIEFTPDGRASVKDMDKPTPGDGEVLVEVTSAGVCGSDYAALHGTHPFRTPPMISGHEVGGRVHGLGPGSSQFRTGDRVVVDPQWPCRSCHLCEQGQYYLCAEKTMLGVAKWPGGLADYVLVPEFTLVPAPAEVPLELLSFAEPLAVAVHAVNRVPDLDTVGRALVLGGGTIGTLITATLTSRLPDVEVTVVEPRAASHETLRVAGASHTVESDSGLPPAHYDAVFIAAGVGSLLNASVRAAATGRTVVQVAVFNTSEPVPAGELQIREISLVGTATYTKSDIAEALQVILDKQDLIARLVTYVDDWGTAADIITDVAANGPGDIVKLIVRRVDDAR